MMTGFDDLPNELILELWHHVHPPDDIVSFALVSKRIFALSAPFLKEYHRLRSKYSGLANYKGYDGIMMAQLLKDVLLDPHIALYVEELRLSIWHSSWEDPTRGVPFYCQRPMSDSKNYVFHVPYPEQDMELFRNGIRKAEHMVPIGTDVWFQLLETGDEDPILALLLSLLPNLRRLRLNPPPVRTPLFTTIRRMIETAVPISFSKLKSIHLEHGVTSQKEATSLVQSFASLTSLEKISCYARDTFFDGEPDIPKCLVSPRSSNVTELVFDSYIDTATHISVLLEGIKMLKKFTFVGHRETFEVSGLRIALLKHCQKSLEYLKLVASSNHAGTLGSLCLFENLKTLEVDHSILVNVNVTGDCNVADLLPASIEAIELTDLGWMDVGHIRPVIRSLVSAKRTELPNLERLNLVFDRFSSIFLNDFSDMRQLCERNGILLNLKASSSSWNFW